VLRRFVFKKKVEEDNKQEKKMGAFLTSGAKWESTYLTVAGTP
jgi:hypothetical protein